jgi:PAS domain S-box-containing protein
MKAGSQTAKWKVLLVEDNPGDVLLLRQLLSESAQTPFELEQVDRLGLALERLTAGGIDLVLLDLSLPDSHGLETFARALALAPQVPIIVMSGLDDEALAIETVHEGAQDYLVKGQVDNHLLTRSMRYAIERKQAEEAFSKERDLFHTLMDNIPDRIFFKDELSRFMRVNRALAERFGLHHPREAMGKTDFDYFTAEHAQPAFEDELRIMRTGEPILGQVEKETLPGGLVNWVLTSKMPLRDKTGKLAGTFGISRDITDLKSAQDALAGERNLLRSLIDNLPDYIYVKDAESRYVIDNISHRQLVGASSQEEVIGKTSAAFFPPDLAAEYHVDDLATLLSGKPLVNHEERVRNRSGHYRWHSTTKVPLRNSDGQIVGLVGIGRDITESKLAEEKLQRANAELAKSQEEMLKVLEDLQKSHDELKSAQFQLIQAEKMQSMGRLAAGVAHEVKNPLAILGMGIDYLTKNLASPDENVGVILHDMNDALQRADTIIRGLLDFSVPRALDLQAEDLNDVVDQSLSLVKHEMSQYPITGVRDLSPDLPKVWLDKNKLKQVFVNIFTNAIHSMEGGGTLTVRTYLKQLQAGDVGHDAGSRLVDRFRLGDTVVVTETTDTGTGIPDHQLAKIFDPFFTTKSTGKGTGLGLTVTKKIIELHGGTITIRNRPEGGVHVTILLKA